MRTIVQLAFLNLVEIFQILKYFFNKCEQISDLEFAHTKKPFRHVLKDVTKRLPSPAISGIKLKFHHTSSLPTW